MNKTGLIFVCLLLGIRSFSQRTATIDIHTSQQGSAIPTTLHGIFFEEISHAGEGGLYAEMIQNRGFEESRIPAGTRLVNGLLEAPPTAWKMEWPYKSEWPAWTVSPLGKGKLTTGTPLRNANLANDSRVAIASLTTEHPLSPATPNSLKLQAPATLTNEGFWGIAVKAGESYK